MAKIGLEGLAHSYATDPKTDRNWALKPLTLECEDGGAYALLGPSGCGKTTLLNLISGLLQPTQGRILFDGSDVTNASPEERNIAQVFQFPVIYDTMTVYENLAFPLRNRGVPAADIDRRVKQLEEKRAEYEKWMKLRQDFMDKATENVVSIYARMRPDAAAERLSEMDPALAAAIMLKLRVKQSGLIMNEMERAIAAKLTGIMASAARKEDPT